MHLCTYCYSGENMKKIFEYIGCFALIIFSFYFTDKISLLVASKSNLMEEIKMVSSSFNKKPIDAQINAKENTIIPGSNGREVNEEESYISMKEFGFFNKEHLVYNSIKPKYTLYNNRDKYIISGNPSRRNVSLIVDDNLDISTYLRAQKIDFDEIVKESKTEVFGEVISGAKGIFSEKSLCIYNYSDIDDCKKKGYFIIKPNITLNASSIITVKDQIKAGSLILISNSATCEHVKALLREIKYKDLNIVYVSKLISEE